MCDAFVQALAQELLEQMYLSRADFTTTFRLLCEVAAAEDAAGLRSRFSDPARFDAWCQRWRSRAASEQAAPAEQAPRRQVPFKDLAAMKSLVSDAWSGWSNEFLVSQQVIDQFAALSGDDYWIHTDPGRAKAESPFGTTIAHGMLVHALVSRLKVPMNYEVTDFGNMVNYGSDRLRFAAPVPSGCRIHARFRVKAVEQVKSGVQLTMEIAIHVVGSERPSVLNDQVILYM